MVIWFCHNLNSFPIYSNGRKTTWNAWKDPLEINIIVKIFTEYLLGALFEIEYCRDPPVGPKSLTLFVSTLQIKGVFSFISPCLGNICPLSFCITMLLISDCLVVNLFFYLYFKPVKIAIFIIQYFPRFLVNLILLSKLACQFFWYVCPPASEASREVANICVHLIKDKFGYLQMFWIRQAISLILL